MAQDPSTIPASIVVTNVMGEALKLEGLKAFAAGEVRTVNLAAFLLAQRSSVWNVITNAEGKGLVTTSLAVFEVDEIATGHQAGINSGGHGPGGTRVAVPGGLGLPATVTFTNLVNEPLVLAGVHLGSFTGTAPGQTLVQVFGSDVRVYGDTVTLFGRTDDTGSIDLSMLPINQQSAVWNALIHARDMGLISSPELTTPVLAGYSGHQGSDNAGGHGNGGQLTFLEYQP